jgi:tetratricopeptide (TPR) repeat protein
MKRISDIPNTSKEMQKIYEKYWDISGDFRTFLPHIDDFLQKYPYYTEALVLKARSLMGIGRNNEALKCLKMAKRIDKWRLIGRFDEAEIYLEKRKNEESIKAYVEAVKAYAVELKNGMDSYQLCCNSESREKLKEITQQALADFFANDEENKPFEKLLDSFMQIKDEFDDY